MSNDLMFHLVKWTRVYAGSLDAVEVVELDAPVDVDVPVGGGPGHVVTLPGHPRNLVAQRRRPRVQRRPNAPPSGLVKITLCLCLIYGLG